MVASKGIEMMEFVLLIGLLSVCNNVLRILRFVIRKIFNIVKRSSKYQIDDSIIPLLNC